MDRSCMVELNSMTSLEARGFHATEVITSPSGTKCHTHRPVNLERNNGCDWEMGGRPPGDLFPAFPCTRGASISAFLTPFSLNFCTALLASYEFHLTSSAREHSWTNPVHSTSSLLLTPLQRSRLPWKYYYTEKGGQISTDEIFWQYFA